MKKIAVIPARYNSTRFPAKLVQDLNGKPVIVRTYLAVKNTQLFDDVIVATDSEQIKQLIESEGGRVFMSVRSHESGSDRIAEAVASIDTDVVVNIQGDEPFVSKENLQAMLDALEADTEKQISLASVMTPITAWEDIENPNHVKVVLDKDDNALYFSRSVIPYPREKQQKMPYFKHIGLYAFRKEALRQFTQWETGVLENIEKLEQLRYLENGKKIKMIRTQHIGIGIDTEEDLTKARLHWHKD
ncbi:3-deoxy-manno-octulosonate cytidylyltransferase [Capnocytophaga sp. ARDL2]|uniref:3-deoxy-manno-octulosonate cytidylyltransferase n=1 Tax=Capnocytophaga sp. ARDL2 TaxID=3238809 RepID=UPI0035574C81